MSSTIDEVLKKMPKLNSSSWSPRDNIFTTLDLPASPNSIARKIYDKWADAYREKINTIILTEDISSLERYKPEEIVNILEFDANPENPNQKIAYSALANQLRDYYQRFEDDDDGPWWIK